MSRKPTKRECVQAINDMAQIIQSLMAAYRNDRDFMRADKMEDFLKKSMKISEPIIDAFPQEYGARTTPPQKDDDNGQ